MTVTGNKTTCFLHQNQNTAMMSSVLFRCKKQDAKILHGYACEAGSLDWFADNRQMSSCILGYEFLRCYCDSGGTRSSSLQQKGIRLAPDDTFFSLDCAAMKTGVRAESSKIQILSIRGSEA